MEPVREARRLLAGGRRQGLPSPDKVVGRAKPDADRGGLGLDPFPQTLASRDSAPVCLLTLYPIALCTGVDNSVDDA